MPLNCLTKKVVKMANEISILLPKKELGRN